MYFPQKIQPPGKIVVLADAGLDFMRQVFGAGLDPANTYIIVDECDYFGSGNNITAYLSADKEGDGHTNVHLIENLALFSHFKMIFGFCPSISAQLVRRIRAHAPDKLRILQFSLGNVRGIGLDTQHKIEYVERTGYGRSSVYCNALDQITYVLRGCPDDDGVPQKRVPKCIFVVHGVQADVQELCDKLATEHSELVGERKLMCLPDIDNAVKATKFNNEFRPYFRRPEGWIFISHRGVNRGVDIAGHHCG